MSCGVHGPSPPGMCVDLSRPDGRRAHSQRAHGGRGVCESPGGCTFDYFGAGRTVVVSSVEWIFLLVSRPNASLVEILVRSAYVWRGSGGGAARRRSRGRRSAGASRRARRESHEACPPPASAADGDRRVPGRAALDCGALMRIGDAPLACCYRLVPTCPRVRCLVRPSHRPWQQLGALPHGWPWSHNAGGVGSAGWRGLPISGTRAHVRKVASLHS